MKLSAYLAVTRENAKLCAHVMRAGSDKDTLIAFTKEVAIAQEMAEKIEGVLAEWKVFSSDVTASCAAGDEELNSLRARTNALLSVG